ncbi:MAG: O-antigen ligase family protein [Gammaproteobacteria bacterium]
MSESFDAGWFGLPRFVPSLSFVGVCIFTLSIVTYWVPWGDFGIGLALLGLAFQRQRLRVSPPVWLFAAFLLWAFVASLAAPYPEIAHATILEFLKLLLIFFALINALRSEGQIRAYLLFFVICFALFPVRGTLVGDDQVFGRAVWNYIYSNPNDLAALSIIALGMCLGFCFSRPLHFLLRVFSLSTAVALTLVIVLTQSRGATIGVVCGLGVPFVRVAFRRTRVLGIAAIAGLALASSLPSTVWHRLPGLANLTSEETVRQADPEGSAEQRLEVLRAGWQMFKDHPAFGVGLGAFGEAMSQYDAALTGYSAHNTYLNLAAETGVVGLLLWLACVASVLRYAYRSRKHAPDSALSTQQAWLEYAAYAYLVASIFGAYAHLSFIYLLLASVWCCAAVLDTKLPPTSGPAVPARR